MRVSIHIYETTDIKHSCEESYLAVDISESDSELTLFFHSIKAVEKLMKELERIKLGMEQQLER